MDPLYGQRTTYPKAGEIPARWIVIDANEQILGRLASKIAARLQGKSSPLYQPGVTVGESIIVINADKVAVTGKKTEQKEYKWHTGFAGGLKKRTMKTQMELAPEKAFAITVKGMLPKNRYGRKLMKRLRIFSGAEHNMQSQNPQVTQL